MKKVYGLAVLVVLMLGSAGCETVAIDQEPVENWDLVKLCGSIGNMRT